MLPAAGTTAVGVTVLGSTAARGGHAWPYSWLSPPVAARYSSAAAQPALQASLSNDIASHQRPIVRGGSGAQLWIRITSQHRV